MRTHGILALCLSLTWLAAPTCEAQQEVAAILPSIGGAEQLSDGVVRGLDRSVRQALRESGFILLDPLRVEALLSTELRGCAPGAACAGDVLEALSTRYLIEIQVLPHSDEPSRPVAIRVDILDATGTRQSGVEPASEAGDFDDAARAAVASAIRAHERYSALSLPERETSGADAETQTSGDVDAATAYRPDEAPVTSEDAPHFANLLLGGGLIAVGVGLVVPGTVNFGLDGQCADAGLFGCRSRYAMDPARDGTLIGLGAALLTAGIVVLALQPLRVAVSASPEEATLQVAGDF